MLVLGGCAGQRGNAPQLERFEFTRLCMGVPTRIVTWAPSREVAVDAAATAFGEIGRLDAIMSDYQRDSELNRLSNSAGGPPESISEDLFRIVWLAQEISLASGGAFDITVGPAVLLWREARRSGVMPSEDALSRARDLIGYRLIRHEGPDHGWRLAKAGMRLDLGGIAKGFAAQRALDLMRRRGLPRTLVALAGDVAAGDAPPGERGWRIALEGERGGRPVGIALLANGSASTSGDTEQFVQIGGRRYSHVIDPHTGIGLTTPRVVSIVGKIRAEYADALATAACVLGPEETRAMLARYSGAAGAAAVFEEPGPVGQQRTVIDPGGVLLWAEPPVAGGIPGE
jgi:thiamine biosynthesis lipoprotein